MTRLAKRFRHRIQASRPFGLRASWDEWQVIDGRRIVSRHDLERQADKWIEEHGAEYPAEVTS